MAKFDHSTKNIKKQNKPAFSYLNDKNNNNAGAENLDNFDESFKIEGMRKSMFNNDLIIESFDNFAEPLKIERKTGTRYKYHREVVRNCE